MVPPQVHNSPVSGTPQLPAGQVTKRECPRRTCLLLHPPLDSTGNSSFWRQAFCSDLCLLSQMRLLKCALHQLPGSCSWSTQMLPYCMLLQYGVPLLSSALVAYLHVAFKEWWFTYGRWRSLLPLPEEEDPTAHSL